MVAKQPDWPDWPDWLLVTLVSLAKESSHLLLNFLSSTGAGLYRVLAVSGWRPLLDSSPGSVPDQTRPIHI